VVGSCGRAPMGRRAGGAPAALAERGAGGRRL